MMKGKHISALGKFHDDGIFETIRAVVLGELGAQAPRLDTNHGVELRVEICGASEDLGRDLELFDRSTGMIYSVLGQIAEQFAKGLRAMKSMAADEPINLLEEKLAVCHTGP